MSLRTCLQSIKPVLDDSEFKILDSYIRENESKGFNQNRSEIEAIQQRLNDLNQDKNDLIQAIEATGAKPVQPKAKAPKQVKVTEEVGQPPKVEIEPAPPAEPAQMDIEEGRDFGGDQVIPFPYISGLSRPADFKAAIEGAAGIGVDASELSAPMIDAVADAIMDGKEVFVDSGAFSAFKAGKELDFDKVFDTYQKILDAIERKGGRYNDIGFLMLTMPDVVGSQERTVALIEEYKENILRIIETGSEIVVPFQKGDMKQSDVYRQISRILEGQGFVTGIPSNAEALSDEDFYELISGTDQHPDRIHILGAVSNKNFDRRMAVIRNAYEDNVPGVTADASSWRAKLNEIIGKPREERDKLIKEVSDEKTPEQFRPQQVINQEGELTIEEEAAPAPTPPTFEEQEADYQRHVAVYNEVKDRLDRDGVAAARNTVGDTFIFVKEMSGSWATKIPADENAPQEDTEINSEQDFMSAFEEGFDRDEPASIEFISNEEALKTERLIPELAERLQPKPEPEPEPVAAPAPAPAPVMVADQIPEDLKIQLPVEYEDGTTELLEVNARKAFVQNQNKISALEKFLGCV